MNSENRDNWGIKSFVKDPSLYISAGLAILFVIFSSEELLRSATATAGSAMVEMSGALLGIVLAGLAIFIAFLDKKYIAVIDNLYGLSNELLPIKTVVILTILSLVFGLGLIIIGEPPNLVLRIVFGMAVWNYLYLLWQIYELVRWLLEHAKARAMQLQTEDKKKNGQ